MGPKFPNISVELIGVDGNAYNVLGIVKKALERAGVSEEEVSEFYTEATSGDYNKLLATVMDTVEVT